MLSVGVGVQPFPRAWVSLFTFIVVFNALDTLFRRKTTTAFFGIFELEFLSKNSADEDRLVMGQRVISQRNFPTGRYIIVCNESATFHKRCKC